MELFKHGEAINTEKYQFQSNLNNVISIAAGGNHSLALKADGTVIAWEEIFMAKQIFLMV